MTTIILDGASGQSSRVDDLVSQIIAEVSADRGDIRHFYLGMTDIGHCQGHFDCWVRSPGRCRLADEAQEIERAVVLADTVIMLTPVCFGALGSGLKKAVDRFLPLILPFFRQHEGMTHHKLRYERMADFITFGIAPETSSDGETETFLAMAESIALDIGASWNAAVLEDDSDLPRIVRETVMSAKAARNPSGSMQAATGMLQNVLKAVPSTASWDSEPHVAILTGSAKGVGKSNSASIGAYLQTKFSELGASVTTVSVTEFARGPNVAQQALETVLGADILVIAAPIYVDGLPYLVTRVLEQLAASRQTNHTRAARLFPVINCGFPEPEHTRFAFAVLRHFARTAHYHFAGGIALAEAEALQGQPLESRGAMTAKLRQALDEAVDALTQGGVLRDETVLGTTEPVIPVGAFRILASAHWYVRAWNNHAPIFGLRARPFRDIPQEEWDALALAGWARARPLRLVGRRPETESAVTLIFEDPAHDPLRYDAGQYITLEAEIGGHIVRRAYSLSSIPRDAHLSITVKRVPGGVMSNYLHDDLQEGDLLRSYGPAGTFTVAPIMGETRRHICLVAGGAGIVPLQAIARSLLLEELRSTVTLIYGSAAPLATIFGSDLADLAKAYPERLQLHMVYEDSADGPGARLDAAGLSPILKQMDLAQLDRILLCGPDAMRTSVRQTMIDAGVVDARIEEEVFRTPRPNAMPTTAQTATLIRADGTQVAIQVEPSATLLDACLEAGEAIRFSCMSGTCGTCRVHLLDGLDNAQVDQPLPASDPTDVMPACVLRLIGPVTFKIPGPNI